MQATSTLRKPGRARDGRALFLVRYRDGHTAFVRSQPDTALARPTSVLAREWQDHGHAPPGEIVQVSSVIW